MRFIDSGVSRLLKSGNLYRYQVRITVKVIYLVLRWQIPGCTVKIYFPRIKKSSWGVNTVSPISDNQMCNMNGLLPGRICSHRDGEKGCGEWEYPGPSADKGF